MNLGKGGREESYSLIAEELIITVDLEWKVNLHWLFNCLVYSGFFKKIAA